MRRRRSLLGGTGTLVKLVTVAAVVIALVYPDSKAGKMIYDLLGQVIVTVRSLLDKIGKLTLADIAVCGVHAVKRSIDRVSAANDKKAKKDADDKARADAEADPAPDEDDEDGEDAVTEA